MLTAYAEPHAAQEGKPHPGAPDLSEPFQRELVDVLKLLADPSRLRILLDLAREGELHVSALCERLGQAQPAVSHHLALLRIAGLIEMRRAGKFNYYSLCHEPFYRIIGELFRALDPLADDSGSLDRRLLSTGE